MSGFKPSKKTKPKILVNIGCLMDIPLSALITGNKGETIINGGLNYATGVVGAGNTFKSTILHYMALSAANRISASKKAYISTYDTEVNISLDRLNDMAAPFEYIDDDPTTSETEQWTITDKANMAGDEWATEMKQYTVEKSKNKKEIITYECFTDPYTKQPLKTLLPSFIEIDSLTEFESETTQEMIDKSAKDDSSTNMLYMRQGMFKTKFLASIPRLAVPSGTYFLMTAHIGDEYDMASGPAKYNVPTKKLQHLKSGDKIKGVSGKFFFLMTSAWNAVSSRVLKNQTTKLAEYPRNRDEANETDLNIVSLKQLRSKTGSSGYIIDVIVSQDEGVLPTLSEFHYIKTRGKFGIEGSDRSYNIVFMPDVKLSRTTVRGKIDGNYKLRRAINISAELHQLKTYHNRYLKAYGIDCSPEELYKDLKEQGYDWSVLLDTRGWHTPNNYSKDLKPYLSTIDLLKLRKGIYKPYWM